MSDTLRLLFADFDLTGFSKLVAGDVPPFVLYDWLQEHGPSGGPLHMDDVLLLYAQYGLPQEALAEYCRREEHLRRAELIELYTVAQDRTGRDVWFVCCNDQSLAWAYHSTEAGARRNLKWTTLELFSDPELIRYCVVSIPTIKLRAVMAPEYLCATVASYLLGGGFLYYGDPICDHFAGKVEWYEILDHHCWVFKQALAPTDLLPPLKSPPAIGSLVTAGPIGRFVRELQQIHHVSTNFV